MRSFSTACEETFTFSPFLRTDYTFCPVTGKTTCFEENYKFKGRCRSLITTYNSNPIEINAWSISWYCPFKTGSAYFSGGIGPLRAVFVLTFILIEWAGLLQNMRADVKYRFSIVNFTKPDSLYNCGMKPVLYSKAEADRHFVGWTRVGDNIRYYRLGNVQLSIIFSTAYSVRTTSLFVIYCKFFKTISQVTTKF